MLVVSPVTALMVDQVTSLKKGSVYCSVVTSSDGIDKDFLAKDRSLSTDSLPFLHQKLQSNQNGGTASMMQRCPKGCQPLLLMKLIACPDGKSHIDACCQYTFVQTSMKCFIS